MPILIVVTHPNKWPLHIPGVEIVSAKSYLLEPSYSDMRGAKVFNLCRSYRYQSLGYYVSLIATARGHNPLPTVMTIQDMKSQPIIRYVSDELDELIQKSLETIQTRKFTLSVYFGRNLAKKYNRLSQHLFNLFPAPLHIIFPDPHPPDHDRDQLRKFFHHILLLFVPSRPFTGYDTPPRKMFHP